MTAQKTITLDEYGIDFNNSEKMVVVAGNNVLESRDLAFQTCEKLKEVTSKLGLPFIYKASFDKANRSSINSYRGPGLEEAQKTFEEIKKEFEVPIITDIHEIEQAKPVATFADIIQMPAFLVRQTNLVKAAAETGKIINLKKMQMMAPWDVKNILKKFEEHGNDRLIVCERGTIFGYNNLVVDPLCVPELKKFGYPIMFDITHSLQQPGGLGEATAGRGQYAEMLGRSIVSMGISSIFIETHPDPTQAKCDGPCATKLDDVEKMLTNLKAIDDLVKNTM
ncbi:3-deoxy-8-phosphooctulonate synthase [bacterium]|nr:3-deoxy-8-phosphooctulonate synthase [bacterium]